MGQAMTEAGNRIASIPGNLVESGMNALIGQPTPHVNPPGIYPRVQRPSDLELSLRGAIPGALDISNIFPRLATTVANPIQLATNVAWGPAFELATASRFANTPLRKLPSMLHPSPSVEETFTKAIRPTVVGKRTATQVATYQSKAEQAVKTIADFRSELALPDEEGNLIPRLPKSLKDMSQAVEQTKFAIFKRYDALASQAGEQGVRVPTISAANAAEEVVGNNIIRRYYPDIAQYAKRWAKNLRSAVSHTPEEIQDLIAKMNADLEAYYRNPQPGSAARAVIDAGIANNLRKSLDTQIEHATGGQYQLLKNLYGSLKTIEKDVNHRMIVFGRQNKKGLIDFSDIFSGAEIVRGITSMNPATFASGVAAKAISTYYKYINNPDIMVKRMFQGVANRSAAPPVEYSGLLTRAAQQVTPALKGVVSPRRK